jgi:hypothetical protein
MNNSTVISSHQAAFRKRAAFLLMLCFLRINYVIQSVAKLFKFVRMVFARAVRVTKTEGIFPQGVRSQQRVPALICGAKRHAINCSVVIIGMRNKQSYFSLNKKGKTQSDLPRQKARTASQGTFCQLQKDAGHHRGNDYP